MFLSTVCVIFGNLHDGNDLIFCGLTEIVGTLPHHTLVSENVKKILVLWIYSQNQSSYKWECVFQLRYGNNLK